MKLLKKPAVVVITLVSMFSVMGTAQADIVANTSLSISVSSHHISSGQSVTISGKLSSSHHACVTHQKIILFGNGRKLAHTRTSLRGKYSFVRRPTRTTRYQTKYPGKTFGVHPNQTTCNPSQSGIEKVRVS